MTGSVQDLRYALRQLRKSPGFTAAIVITLTLAVGGNTAIFSVINAVMLRTLPVRDPGRLVLLKWKAENIRKTKGSSSYANCPPGSGLAAETLFQQGSRFMAQSNTWPGRYGFDHVIRPPFSN